MDIDTTSMKDYLQSEDAYEKKRQRMKQQYLDNIVNDNYCYVKIDAAPSPIDPMIYKIYNSIHKLYHATKYVCEFTKNLVLRK